MPPESPSTSSRQRAAEEALHRYWAEFLAQARALGLPTARLAGRLPIDGAILQFEFRAGQPPLISWQPIEADPAP